jgi:hypothetical protein
VRGVLCRSMAVDEARYVMAMARRIAALLLEPRLDASYRAVKGARYAWAGGDVSTRPSTNSQPTSE